jgi:hypothetical protein
MSTVQKINFEPVSDINPVHRRDFMIADPTLVNPINAVALVDGEWMTLDNTAGPTFGKLIRATNIAVVGNPAAVVSFPLFAERGRYDIQAIAEKKMPVLFLGQYEFDTRIYNAAVVVGAGAAITTLLQPVKVATISATLAGVGVRNFTGLVGSAYADNVPIVGYVTRLPGANGGKLRFISGWAVQNGAA